MIKISISITDLKNLFNYRKNKTKKTFEEIKDLFDELKNEDHEECEGIKEIFSEIGKLLPYLNDKYQRRVCKMFHTYLRNNSGTKIEERNWCEGTYVTKELECKKTNINEKTLLHILDVWLNKNNKKHIIKNKYINLSYINFQSVKLDNFDLSDIKIQNSDLSKTKLICNLKNTNVKGSSFIGVKYSKQFSKKQIKQMRVVYEFEMNSFCKDVYEKSSVWNTKKEHLNGKDFKFNIKINGRGLI